MTHLIKCDCKTCGKVIDVNDEYWQIDTTIVVRRSKTYKKEFDKIKKYDRREHYCPRCIKDINSKLGDKK